MTFTQTHRFIHSRFFIDSIYLNNLCFVSKQFVLISFYETVELVTNQKNLLIHLRKTLRTMKVWTWLLLSADNPGIAIRVGKFVPADSTVSIFSWNPKFKYFYTRCVFGVNSPQKYAYKQRKAKPLIQRMIYFYLLEMSNLNQCLNKLKNKWDEFNQYYLSAKLKAEY